MSILDSNQVSCIGKMQKVILYTDRTTPVGSNYWKEVPSWARWCRLCITMPDNDGYIDVVSASIGRGQSKPLVDYPTGWQNVPSKSVIESSMTRAIWRPTILGFSDSLVFDVTNIGWLSFGVPTLNAASFSAWFEFYADELPEKYYKILNAIDSAQETDALVASGFNKFFESDKVKMYNWKANSDGRTALAATFRNVIVWTGSGKIIISTDGFNGATTEIAFNATNFPGLIEGSSISQIIVMPWSRSPSGNVVSLGGDQWRMNVITSMGQIYHNFPSRSMTGDGNAVAGDEFRFDESVVWDLPTRFTPVKTESGDDADLIATGKYKYMPCYPDVSYGIYPPLNHDNGYNNGGFGATIEKTVGSETKKFGRFWFPDRSNGQANPFFYMGGNAVHEKMTLIGTYRSNNDIGVASRICVFGTIDGGRQWFCLYEFGSAGHMTNSRGGQLDYAEGGNQAQAVWLFNLAYSGNVGSGIFKVRRRIQILPDAEDKEPENKFSYSDWVNVTSIAGTSDHISINVAIADTEILQASGDYVFEKVQGAAATPFDWLVNDSCDEMTCGNGVIFKMQRMSLATGEYYLHDEIHNPDNNLPCRHIHSVDRNKFGYAISTGEVYPTGGWILFMSMRPADSFSHVNPWDDLQFIRLNSTKDSFYRSLGTYVMQNGDMFLGVDDAMIPMGNVALPTGRTDEILKNSTGVFKLKVSEIDNAANAECLLNTHEVAYFFKIVEGVMIFVGQQGGIAVSLDYGQSWYIASAPKSYTGRFEHFGGVTDDKCISIDGLVLKISG